MKTRFLVALTIAFALPLLAQEKPAPLEKEKEKDIRRMLELNGSDKMLVKTAEQMIQQHRQTMPQVPAQVWDEIRKEIKPEDLMNILVPIYDKKFEHDEIKEIIKFYESPVGKKLAAAQPQIMEEAQQAGTAWGAMLAVKIMEKMRPPIPPAAPKVEPKEEK